MASASVAETGRVLRLKGFFNKILFSIFYKHETGAVSENGMQSTRVDFLVEVNEKVGTSQALKTL